MLSFFSIFDFKISFFFDESLYQMVNRKLSVEFAAHSGFDKRGHNLPPCKFSANSKMIKGVVGF